MGNYATWKMLDGLNVTFPFLYATLVLDIFPPVFDPIFTSVEAKARPLQPMPGLSSPPVGSFIRTQAMAARAGSIGSSPTNVTFGKEVISLVLLRLLLVLWKGDSDSLPD